MFTGRRGPVKSHEFTFGYGCQMISTAVAVVTTFAADSVSDAFIICDNIWAGNVRFSTYRPLYCSLVETC